VIQLDPTVALSEDQRNLLASADVRDPKDVLRISGSLTLEQLTGVRMLTNARTLLSALAEGPVRATKGRGNFERRFVARVRDELLIRPDDEWLLEYSRGENEEEVPGLHVLRVVLGVAGLLKKRNGRFSITERGRRLLQPGRAVELYELLLRTYFGKFNIFYPCGYREDPVIQRRIVLALWIIRRLAEHPVGSKSIAYLIPHDEMRWHTRLGSYKGELEHAVAAVVLEALQSFGLLSGGETIRGSRSYERTPWQVTPLFDEAISFDIGALPSPGEVDAAPDGPVPSIARLLITLDGVEPPVWRRVEVPADITFERLHAYLVTAMGWLDYHLHAFEIGRRRIAANDADWESEWPHENEAGITLLEALDDRHRTFLYRYDFGDDWEHVVKVEAVEGGLPGTFYPRCLEASGACPPEDSVGVPGYLRLLEALADPGDPEHDHLVEWVGGAFDPEAVDVEGINRLLRLAATGEIRAEDLDYFASE